DQLHQREALLVLEVANFLEHNNSSTIHFQGHSTPNCLTSSLPWYLFFSIAAAKQCKKCAKFAVIHRLCWAK
ncbi:MAG: hypothetical protein UC991_06605, partial [Gemmiger sp.]|uniref:hypothetical protein n=1 Tax=Gemmiger sp. TaxID=2049027 RepID=UPI002E76C2D2